jgi:prepilin-type N-terminal cleavage/methylation domain-containing protein
MRRLLQSEMPIAAAIEKPDAEKGSAAAVHPGAAAYYDNNEKSFMDRYGDWLYIGAMALSGLGSMIAAMFGLTRARARKVALALIDQLIEVKQIAQTTRELSRLDGLEAQIEDVSTKGLRFARDNNFDEAGLAALRVAIDEARRAISDQRDELQPKPLRVKGRRREQFTTNGLAAGECKSGVYHKGRQDGFTLVETLVVITIIGLIMGLVGPRVLNYLSQSKVKAGTIQIQSFASPHYATQAGGCSLTN